MAKTPHGTKGWIEYMEGARKYFAQNGTLNGYDFYKWNNQRWYPDNKSRVIPNKNFNPNRRIGNNLYSPKSYESKLKDVDWVVIATPDETHYEIVRNCIFAKKNVF